MALNLSLFVKLNGSPIICAPSQRSVLFFSFSLPSLLTHFPHHPIPTYNNNNHNKQERIEQFDVTELNQHNFKYLTRLYPKGFSPLSLPFSLFSLSLSLSLQGILIFFLLLGTRFDSSNYMPDPGWNSGCQVCFHVYFGILLNDFKNSIPY